MARWCGEEFEFLDAYSKHLGAKTWSEWGQGESGPDGIIAWQEFGIAYRERHGAGAEGERAHMDFSQLASFSGSYNAYKDQLRAEFMMVGYLTGPDREAALRRLRGEAAQYAP